MKREQSTVNWMFVHEIVEPVIWLELIAFDEVWRKADGYIGVGGAGSKHGSRYKRVGEFIRSSEVLHYPHITLDGDALVFSDGRHRLAWLRDHGASAIPVTTSPRDAARLQALFGSNLRVTRYR